MTRRFDTGPAFSPPITVNLSSGGKITGGVDLRDWFAGQALIGLLSCSDVGGSLHDFSSSAYKYADTMLSARKKTP